MPSEKQKTIGHYAMVLTEISKQSSVGIAEKKDDFYTSESWVDNDFVASMVKRIWNSTDDEFLGLADHPMARGTWGLVCEYMLNTSTLGELFRQGAHVLKFLGPESFGYEFQTNGSDSQLVINCYQGRKDPHRFLSEFIGVTLHRFPCWAIDRYIPLKQAWFSYPKPDHAWFYEELFQCSIEFDQETTGFAFDSKYLDIQIGRTKTDLADWLDESPANMLYLQGRTGTIAMQIRTKLNIHLKELKQIPSFDAISQSLNMSPAVIRRRLAEEGENYQQIKDSVRLNLVKEMLSNSELPIADVAIKAGFQELASLSRAFKKWTDYTPAEYRKSNS